MIWPKLDKTEALNTKTVWSCTLSVLKVSLPNGFKKSDKRARHGAKGFIVVAPKQVWEKVTFAFKFCPFKTKMVKGTLSFVIKLCNKTLRLEQTWTKKPSLP